MDQYWREVVEYDDDGWDDHDVEDDDGVLSV